MGCHSWRWGWFRALRYVPPSSRSYCIFLFWSLAVQFAVAQGLRVIAIGQLDILIITNCSHSAIDTGEDKKKLAMSLGAEKWIDFKESKDLVFDVQALTGGLGPHAAIIATGNVGAL